MRNTRHAFTIMELVLVLAIIIIAAAISFPVIGAMLTDSRINASADAVRGKMAEARSRAMEDGRPWRLGFIANTGVWQLAPEDSGEWDNTTTELKETDDLVRDELPKEVVFALSHEDIMNNEQAQSPGGVWQTIGIFLRDGSARDDTTTYFGKPGQAPMRVKLRGLTGAVSVEVFTSRMAGQ